MVNKKPKAKTKKVTKAKVSLKTKTSTKAKTADKKPVCKPVKKHISHAHLLAVSIIAIAASFAAMAVSNLASAATYTAKMILPLNKTLVTTAVTSTPPVCTTVGVLYSCRTTNEGIYIRYSTSSKEALLTNGCRDAGYGLRNYSLACTGTTTYKVCYTSCGAATSTTSTVALSRLSFFNAPSPTTTARMAKALVGTFKIFTFDQNANLKNLNFMATGTINTTQYYLYNGSTMVASNFTGNQYQIYFDLNNYRLTKGVTTTFDIYANTSQQTIGSFTYLFLDKTGVKATDAVNGNTVTEISGMPLNIGPIYVAR